LGRRREKREKKKGGRGKEIDYALTSSNSVKRPPRGKKKEGEGERPRFSISSTSSPCTLEGRLREGRGEKKKGRGGGGGGVPPFSLSMCARSQRKGPRLEEGGGKRGEGSEPSQDPVSSLFIADPVITSELERGACQSRRKKRGRKRRKGSSGPSSIRSRPFRMNKKGGGGGGKRRGGGSSCLTDSFVVDQHARGMWPLKAEGNYKQSEKKKTE